MPAHPAPLLLPADATDVAVRALIAERFGPGSTIIGVTAPGGHHPGIHRGGLAIPGMPRCGMVSHGELQPITQVLAAIDSPDAHQVIRLLRAAGIAPCRMCRRCWRTGQLPQHSRIRCFSTRTV